MSKKRQSKPRELRHCQRCSVAFIPQKRQIYCSPECRKPRVIFQSRLCLYCNHEFTPKRKAAVYCSSRCRSRAALLRQEAKRAKLGLSKPSKPLETRQCVCGVRFDQKRHWQKYCSDQCGDRQRQKQFIEGRARELIGRGFYSTPDGNPS